jgi:hypothetical protein
MVALGEFVFALVALGPGRFVIEHFNGSKTLNLGKVPKNRYLLNRLGVQSSHFRFILLFG